jgi:hypothetical protein
VKPESHKPVRHKDPGIITLSKTNSSWRLFVSDFFWTSGSLLVSTFHTSIFKILILLIALKSVFCPFLSFTFYVFPFRLSCSSNIPFFCTYFPLVLNFASLSLLEVYLSIGRRVSTWRDNTPVSARCPFFFASGAEGLVDEPPPHPPSFTSQMLLLCTVSVPLAPPLFHC